MYPAFMLPSSMQSVKQCNKQKKTPEVTLGSLILSKLFKSLYPAEDNADKNACNAYHKK